MGTDGTDPTETDMEGTDTPTDPDSELRDAEAPDEPPPIQPRDAGPGPRVTGTDPDLGAANVPTDTDVTIRFDRQVVAAEGVVTLHESINDAEVEAVDVSDDRITIDGDELTVDWEGTLATSTGYYVLIEPGALEDQDGNPFSGLIYPDAYAFTTVAPGVLNLVRTIPENGDDNVPRNRSLRLTFNQQIVAGLEGEVRIVESATQDVFEAIPITDEVRVSISGTQLDVNPQGIFSYDTEYYVAVDPGTVASTEGTEFDGLDDPEGFRFTTSPAPPLNLANTVPSDDAVGVDPATSLVLVFDEPISAGSGELRVHQTDDDSVVESAAVDASNVVVSGLTVTVDLQASLATGTEYYVSVDQGFVVSDLSAAFVGISDAAGFSFTTAEAELDELLLANTTPLFGATGTPVATQLTMEFSEEVAVATGFVTVFTVDDELVESINVENVAQVLVSGNEVTAYLNRSLEGGTEYYVTIGAGSFISAQGASFAGLADQSWSFETERVFGLDSASPNDDAVGVDPSTDLTLNFNEAIIVGEGTLEIRDLASDAVIETVNLDDSRVSVADSSITVDLDNILASETGYYVIVDDGAISAASDGSEWSGFRNSNGWAFTTAAVNFPAGTGSGLALWLDASYGRSVKGSNGVALWADRSGKFNNVRQSSSGARPQRVADAMNGGAVLRFDGNDRLTRSGAGLQMTAFDGFIVWQSDASADSRKSSLLSNDRNTEVNIGHPFDPVRNSTASCVGNACADEDGWYVVQFVPTPDNDTPYLWNWGFNALTTSLFTRANGGAAVFQSGPTDTPVLAEESLMIGDCTLDDCGYEGDIAEVVIYSRSLTHQERASTVAYLRDKWGFATVDCGASEELGPTGSCYFVSAQARSWDSARGECLGRGAGWDLATIRTQAEHAFVTGLLTDDAAIGGTDDDVEGTWRWVTDTLQFWSGADDGMASNGSYEAWGAMAPSDDGSDNCARYVQEGGSWVWADYDCSEPHGFVCEGPGN